VRLISLFCFGAVTLCFAQRSIVNVDELPVHSGTSSESGIAGSLKRGNSVTVGLVLSGGGQSWCEISYPGPPPIAGFVPCAQLQREPLSAEPNYTVAGPATSATPSVNTDAAISEALRLSGIDQAIQQLGDPSLYLSNLPQAHLSPAQAAEVKQLVMQSMRPERFQQAVAASLKRSYPADAYPQLLDTLRSPLARRMTALELAASRVDPITLQTFLAGLRETPPGAQHLAIVNRIDQATGSSQLLVEIVSAVLEGFASGSGQMTPPQISKLIEEVRGERGNALRQAGQSRLLYQYRGVPDDQLNAYATMLSAPVVVRFNQSAQRGLLDAARQAADEMMRSMIRRFPTTVPPPK